MRGYIDQAFGWSKRGSLLGRNLRARISAEAVSSSKAADESLLPNRIVLQVSDKRTECERPLPPLKDSRGLQRMQLECRCIEPNVFNDVRRKKPLAAACATYPSTCPWKPRGMGPSVPVSMRSWGPSADSVFKTNAEDNSPRQTRYGFGPGFIGISK